MAEDKSIIRVQKNKDNPYTMINSTYVEDDRMSWKAKGLMTYFLTRPDDWKIMICDLIKRSTDKKDAVSTGMKELINFGYVVKIQLRDEKGRMAGTEYIVYEVPINRVIEPKAENPETDNPKVEKPQTGNPKTGEPKTDNPPLLSIESLPSIENQSVSTDELTDILEKCYFDDFDSDDVRNTFEPVIEKMFYSEPGIKLNGAFIPQAIVRKNLQRINVNVIDFVKNKIKEIPPGVTNKTGYIATMIYNAIHENYSDMFK